MTPRLRIAVLLGVVLLAGAPPRWLLGQEPATPAAAQTDLPARPGGVDLSDPQAVSDRLQDLVKERDEAQKTAPDDQARLAVLNRQIAVLDSHRQFLEAVARDRADRASATETDLEQAREEADAAHQALEKLDLPSETRDLRWSGTKPEKLREVVATSFTEPLQKAREQSDQAAQRQKDLQAELARLPDQDADAAQKLAAALAKIAELQDREREAKGQPDFPEKEFNLLRRQVESWQQEAVHQVDRQKFLAGRKDLLTRAAEIAKLRADAAASRLARAQAVASAAQAVLEERLAAESAATEEKIGRKRAELEAATAGYARIRIGAELENLELAAEVGRRTQRAAAVDKLRIDLEGRRKDAQVALAGYEKVYGPDAPEADRPSSETVSGEIRRLDQATDARAYFREVDEFRRERTAVEAELAKAVADLQGLDALFAERVARARAEWDAAEQAGGTAWRPPWDRVALALDEAQKERASLLSRRVDLLGPMAKGLAAAAADRETLHEVQSETLLLLRRENLFLRGKSHITWDAVKDGFRDVALLPEWVAGAASGVASYVTDPNHGRPLLLVVVLLAAVIVILLFLRRWLSARIRRLAEAAVDGHTRKAAIVLSRIFRALSTGVVMGGVLYLASWLLPEPVPVGVRRILAGFSWIAGGFWIAREAVRVFLRGESEAGYFLPFDPAASQRIGLGVGLFLYLSVVLLPLGLLLRELGYPNEGALELVDLAYKVLAGLVVLAVLFRRRHLLGLFPPAPSRLARFLRVLVTALHPVFVLLVPGLLLLEVLRYDILAGLIAAVALNTAVAAVLAYLLYRAAVLFVDRRLERSPPPDAADREARTGVVHFLLRLGFFFGAIWAVFAVRGGSLQEVKTFFSKPLPFLGESGPDPATWWNLIVAVTILYLTLAGTRHLKAAIRLFVLRGSGMDRGLRYTIVTLLGYVLVTTGIVMAARQMFDLSSLGYMVAALSVGIGFGLQEIVSNFVSGIILLFERSLRVGDLVEVGGTEGIVREIRVRSTTVLTQDNVFITVPNRDFMTQNVVNYVGGDEKMRLRAPFGVSYSSDPEHVRTTLLAMVRDFPKGLAWPSPEVRFKGFGDSSLDFDLLVWIQDTVDKNRIRSDLYYAMFAALTKAGIEIPFPQRDLHLRSSEPIRLVAPEPSPPPRAPEEE